jgi:hypothetical protein
MHLRIKKIKQAQRRKPLQSQKIISISTGLTFLVVALFYVNIGTNEKGVANPLTTPTLSFSTPVLVNGIAGTLNAEYIFSQIVTGVDGYIKINSIYNGASVTTFDLGSVSAGYDGAFQPVVSFRDGSSGSPQVSYIEWLISFKVAGTTRDTVLSNIVASAIDIDGNSTVREKIQAFSVKTFSVNPLTELTVAQTADSITAEASTTDYGGVDSTNSRAIFQINFKDVNQIIYRTIGINQNSSRVSRQFSIFFRSFFSSSGSLPVELISFTGKKTGQDEVKLQWQTATEKDNDYFTLSRSKDGFLYEELAKVEGAGNSITTKNYEYSDYTSITGTLYYQLKQTDINGQYEIFRPICVGSSTAKGKLKLIDVAPNPFISSCRLKFETDESGPVTINVYSVRGSLIKSISVEATEGFNIIDLDNFENMEPGYFLVSATQNQQQSNALKVIKN